MFRIIRYSFVALAALIMLQACTKKEVLELGPDFTLEAISNPSNMDQVEQVLLGAYARFRDANYYGSGSGTGAGWSLMPDVLSDNLYETKSSLANSRTMADWTYNQNTGQISTYYSVPYAVIANANIVLRDVDKFTTTANQGRANRLKGQALTIRALAHFDLFRYFATRYDRNSTDLAVAYVKEFILPGTSAVQPARMTNKEFYDNLFADLTQATSLLGGSLDKTINPSSGLTRPYLDAAGAYALQARAYLYAGMFTEAITASTNAINLRPLVNGVTSPTAFSGMYNETNAGEIIWNVQFESGQSGPTFLVYFATTKRNYFRPALEIADTTGASGLIRNNDVRYSAYFTQINDNNSRGLALTKYRGKGATVSDGNANFPVFRTGEMYLIRAEARAKSNQELLALQDLNTLRANRIAGYVPEVLTGTALLDAIANERRRELVGEGHRFFDLKRTTRTVQRGSVCGTSLSPSGDCLLAPTDREWALPIPETFVKANPAQVQNPGYN